MDCVLNGFYSYPISHVVIPMIISYYYGKGFNSVLFAITAAAVWELVEFTVRETFGSYLLFGDTLINIYTQEERETVCNIVLLDIGNGILGAFLAYFTARGKLSPNFKYWQHVVAFIIVGVTYSFLSGFSWYCSWDESCNGERVDFPWGNFVNVVLIFVWFWIFFIDWAWLFLNVIIISGMGTIPVVSSAVMVYIGTAVCFLIQIFRPREYQILP